MTYPFLRKRRIFNLDYEIDSLFLVLYNTLLGDLILGRSEIICFKLFCNKNILYISGISLMKANSNGKNGRKDFTKWHL